MVWRKLKWAALCAAVATMGTSWSMADEPAKTKPAPAAAKEGAAEEKPVAEKPVAEKPVAKKPVDPFAVPEGNDPKVLQLFMSRLQRTPPAARTPEGIQEHLNKLEKVTDELLTRELEEEMLTQAVGMKVQIMGLLPQFGDEGAAKRRSEFLAKAAIDERPAVAKMAAMFLKVDKVEKIADLKKEERAALIQQLAKDIQEGELDQDELQLAEMAGNSLAGAELNDEAVAALNLFAKYVEANGHPKASKIAQGLRGTANRLGLMGNPIEIAGKTLDGKDFKIESLKGKVVLIDFWATWCGPCRAEFPNMLEHYALYHDKGFEIVGISLDEDRDALDEFMKEEKLPWMQLHQNDGTGWGNENAIRYGISGIPACFLVDQEGKVVSLNCRGEELPKLLEKLLGPVEKQPAKEEEEEGVLKLRKEK